MEPELICMICGQVKNDSDGPEVDEYGDWWKYCRDCDCWTSHPPTAPTPRNYPTPPSPTVPAAGAPSASDRLAARHPAQR